MLLPQNKCCWMLVACCWLKNKQLTSNQQEATSFVISHPPDQEMVYSFPIQ